ncbi:MAG: ZIP family metal transporter [Halobacteriaceae archaeon]
MAGLASRAGRAAPLGVAGTLALVALTAVAWEGAPTLAGIAWIAFFGMAGGALLGGRARADHPLGLVWGYGLASGAMVASASAFLLPSATGHDPRLGGFGVAAGLLVGFGGHAVGHRLTHFPLPMDRTVAALTAHAVAAGAIIGAVYTTMPALGPLLGLAIVSHKGPAGYAAARRLARAGRSPLPLLAPASGLGVTALAVSLLSPARNPALQAVVFGFAAGVFLHVAMDFLPSCEAGDEIYEMAGDGAGGVAHAVLDRLRLHAVVSTGLGGLAVFAAWLAVSG